METNMKTESRVTLKMVAEYVGLTAGTISAVLNNTKAAQRIPQHTRERVLAAARELNYQPNPLARALRMGQPMHSETTTDVATSGRAVVIVDSDQLQRALVAIQQAGLRVHDDFSVLEFGEVPGAWDFPSFSSAPDYPNFDIAPKPA